MKKSNYEKKYAAKQKIWNKYGLWLKWRTIVFNWLDGQISKFPIFIECFENNSKLLWFNTLTIYYSQVCQNTSISEIKYLI